MSNPSVTFRLTEEDKERVRELALKSGKSLGQILREALGVSERSDAAAYEEGKRYGLEIGRQQGFEAARYTLRVPCAYCGEKVDIDFTHSDVLGEAYWDIVEYGKRRWSLGHLKCIEASRNRA